MRAVTIPRFGDDDVLTITDIPTPAPGSGQVAIDVAFAGVNFVEILCRRGVVGVPLPFVPGIEVAGYFRALGPRSPTPTCTSGSPSPPSPSSTAAATHGSRSSGLASCRPDQAGTTSSRSRSQPACELPSRSTRWPWRSDPSARHGVSRPPVDQTQQSPGASAADRAAKGILMASTTSMRRPPSSGCARQPASRRPLIEAVRDSIGGEPCQAEGPALSRVRLRQRVAYGHAGRHVVFVTLSFASVTNPAGVRGLLGQCSQQPSSHEPRLAYPVGLGFLATPAGRRLPRCDDYGWRCCCCCWGLYRSGPFGGRLRVQGRPDRQGGTSAAETALLAVDAARGGKASCRYLAQVLAEAEEDATAAQGTFDAIQPPGRRVDRLRSHLDELLTEATATLTELQRPAAFLADLRSAPPPAASQPALAATQGGTAANRFAGLLSCHGDAAGTADLPSLADTSGPARAILVTGFPSGRVRPSPTDWR